MLQPVHLIRFFIISLIGSMLISVAYPQTPLSNQPQLTPPLSFHGTNYLPISQWKNLHHLETESSPPPGQVVLENQYTSIVFTINQHAVIINRIKLFLSHPIILHNKAPFISVLDINTLMTPALSPASILPSERFQTIIIDPGHGGSDHGSNHLEAAYTLRVAKILRKELSIRGHHVILTRSKDVTLPLEDRLRMINREKKAIVISLHFNAGPPSIHGMESYIPSASAPTTKRSLALAMAIHSKVLHSQSPTSKSDPLQKSTHQPIADRGIRHAGFAILKKSSHPSVLIELGFLTHEKESQRWADPEETQKTIAAIAQGITTFRKPTHTLKTP